MSKSRSKMTLIYSKYDGVAIPDHTAEETARSLKKHPLNVSTENVVHAFRCLLHEGFFEKGEVNVYYEETRGKFLAVNFDENGRTFDWHTGFCDTSDDFLQRLLGAKGSK